MDGERDRRPTLARAAALAGAGALVAGVVSLLPPSAQDWAIYALVITGLLGGSWARAGREVLALVIGAVAGALLAGVATYGTPLGPSSPGSLALGLAMTAGITGIIAACFFWFLGVLRSAGFDADEAGSSPPSPGTPPLPAAPPAPDPRRIAWRAIGLTLVAGLALLAAAVAIALGSLSSAT
jgi:hypothetical protein